MDSVSYNVYCSGLLQPLIVWPLMHSLSYIASRPRMCSLARKTTSTRITVTVVLNYCDPSSPVLMSNINSCWKQHRSRFLQGQISAGHSNWLTVKAPDYPNLSAPCLVYIKIGTAVTMQLKFEPCTATSYACPLSFSVTSQYRHEITNYIQGCVLQVYTYHKTVQYDF